MRTNIVLDDELLENARRYSEARTKRALVEEALRTFVEVKEAQQRRQTYRQRLSRLSAQLAELELGEAPSSVLRAARERT